MDLRRIKTVNHNNVDRLIKENLYRGFCVESRIYVQCMNKNCNICFDFNTETATIEMEERHTFKGYARTIDICDLAPKRLYEKIKLATC